jgi:RNA polymerase sigma-70 factor (ECF subfamily)
MPSRNRQAAASGLLCLVDEESPFTARLREASADLEGVEVVLERREGERRARVGLREEASSLIRLPAGGTSFRADRRKVERRMELRPAEAPATLRALAAEHPRAARFVRRLTTPAADAKAAELIQRVQAGDADALDELYRLYLAPLYGYMVVTLRDHHAAEDAVHEVFVRVLRALPRYELRGIPFRIWLFRIARNHVLNLATRQRPEDLRDPDDVHRALERDKLDRGEADLTELSDDEFLRLIQILPLSQRQVLVLRYVLDMSFAEIASVLGLSAAAARNQQRRAFAALKPRLLAQRRAAAPASHLAMSLLRREPPVVRRRGDALLYRGKM